MQTLCVLLQALPIFINTWTVGFINFHACYMCFMPVFTRQTKLKLVQDLALLVTSYRYGYRYPVGSLSFNSKSWSVLLTPCDLKTRYRVNKRSKADLGVDEASTVLGWEDTG
jgi:hypothetical protein